MKKKIDPYDLVDFVLTEVSVQCQGKICGKMEGAQHMEDYDLCKYIIKKGWKVSSRGTLYCPSCVKKYLKS